MGLTRKTSLKVPKMDFDTKKELSIYDYDGKIDDYYNAISLHPNISENTAKLIQSYQCNGFRRTCKGNPEQHLELLFSL